ncbi:hypothetical protein EW026_g5444 [Hermanssonia centrifuga]|uniref:EF-hand domain-containing protein n=1 Tax=Hermanssonia centrifuga TaxID=98765 RepID=A0A4S4KE45_9APHY|nr:hypothetical protein EW026_g5444 [Hermanssonia centrifuga]
MPVQAQAALAEGEIALDLLGNDLKGSIQKGQSRDRAVSVNSTAQDVVSVKFKSAKARLDSYKATSDALLQVLDAVAELHPFISVAALPFKAAIKIVLNKKANDKSVLVLFVEMSDMMSSLVLLRAVKPDQRDYEGTSLVVRLDKCLCAVAKEIERCAAACATYEKQKYIVKLVKNGEWEDSLKAFTEAFHGHKERIQWEISVHVGITIDELKSSVGEFAAMIRSTDSNSSMVLLMRQLRSPGERELQDFIKSKGGPDRFLKDEKAMQELTLRASGVEGFGNTKVLSPKEQEEVIREMTRDLKKSFASMVKDDEDRFTNLFKLYQGRISSDMRTESDRIINVINTGAHEKIQDPDLHGLWKDMGWKGTTKARHLVMALRELYVERHKTAMSAQHNALNAIRDIASPSNPQPDSVKVQEIAEVTKTDVQLEDSWALQYISIPRIQPLLEAFDDDGSSLVSVTEVNAFTAAKPQAWSLPRWMAYWTAGMSHRCSIAFDRLQWEQVFLYR